VVFFISAIKKSDSIVYKLFVARAKIFWGDNVHALFVVVGVMLNGLSSLFIFVIWG
jgi:hypothetical protein